MPLRSKSMSGLLSYEDAAERLRCHRNTIRKLVRLGTLPVVRMSATLARIPADALAELVERKVNNAQT